MTRSRSVGTAARTTTKDVKRMTMTLRCVPCNGLEWRQWARAMIEALELCSGEANVLRLLADRAAAGGTVRLGVPLMARQLVLSESQVYRWLRALARRGLLRTRQQGRGRIALRQLIAVPEPVQLSLFDAPASEPEMPAAAPVVSPWAQQAAEACPRMDAIKPSHQCEPAVEGQKKIAAGDARDAREPTPEPVEDGRSAGVGVDLRDRSLQPRLAEVVAILEAAPDLFVEPLSLNAALAAHPEDKGYDHLRAAWTVASYAFEGGLHNTSANRQLLIALGKQQRPAPTRHGGRARRAIPAPTGKPKYASEC